MDQSSQNNMDVPPMCANGCGFYSSVENKNLCSTCYRDYLKQQINLANSAMAKLNLASNNCITTTTAAAAAAGGISLPSQQTNSSIGVKKMRCQSCNKRVGLLGFNCRCGGVFCGMHRYPEEHSCHMDLKMAGRDLLAKQNPLCKGDKLQWKI